MKNETKNKIKRFLIMSVINIHSYPFSLRLHQKTQCFLIVYDAKVSILNNSKHLSIVENIF